METNAGGLDYERVGFGVSVRSAESDWLGVSLLQRKHDPVSAAGISFAAGVASSDREASQVTARQCMEGLLGKRLRMHAAVGQDRIAFGEIANL